MTQGDLFVLELGTLGRLRIDSGGDFFLRVGGNYRIRVRRQNDDGTFTDLTGNPRNFYFTTSDGSASVTAEGSLLISYTIAPLVNMTPSLFVIVRNGADVGLGQFAVVDIDSDGDGLSDSYERRIGLDPL